MGTIETDYSVGGVGTVFAESWLRLMHKKGLFTRRTFYRFGDMVAVSETMFINGVVLGLALRGEEVVLAKVLGMEGGNDSEATVLLEHSHRVAKDMFQTADGLDGPSWRELHLLPSLRRVGSKTFEGPMPWGVARVKFRDESRVKQFLIAAFLRGEAFGQIRPEKAQAYLTQQAKEQGLATVAAPWIRGETARVLAATANWAAFQRKCGRQLNPISDGEFDLLVEALRKARGTDTDDVTSAQV